MGIRAPLGARRKGLRYRRQVWGRRGSQERLSGENGVWRNPRDEAESEEKGVCSSGGKAPAKTERHESAGYHGSNTEKPRGHRSSVSNFPPVLESRDGGDESTAILNPPRLNPVIPGQSPHLCCRVPICKTRTTHTSSAHFHGRGDHRAE